MRAWSFLAPLTLTWKSLAAWALLPAALLGGPRSALADTREYPLMACSTTPSSSVRTAGWSSVTSCTCSATASRATRSRSIASAGTNGPAHPIRKLTGIALPNLDTSRQSRLAASQLCVSKASIPLELTTDEQTATFACATSRCRLGAFAAGAAPCAPRLRRAEVASREPACQRPVSAGTAGREPSRTGSWKAAGGTSATGPTCERGPEPLMKKP